MGPKSSKMSFLHTTLILINRASNPAQCFNVFCILRYRRNKFIWYVSNCLNCRSIFRTSFLMVLGSYLVRSRPFWQRVSFGVFVFLAFYVLDGIYRSLNGMAFLNTWPNAPFFAELVFIPVYAILTVALSTLYLYLLPEKQHLLGRILSSKKYFWNRYIVPIVLLVRVQPHIWHINPLSRLHDSFDGN